MKELSPTQAKKLIAYLIKAPKIPYSVSEIIANEIYKIARSVEPNTKQAWKKNAVALFKSHEL